MWSGSRLACLPLPFICLPILFICLPGWVLVVGFPAGLSPTSFHLSPSSFHLSPRLVACGRVPGWLVSHFLVMCPPLFLICLPIPFICLPGWVLAVGFPADLSATCFHLSPSSFHLSPRLGACGRVPGWLVSHFLSFVSQFFFPKQFTVGGSQCFKEWSPWCWMVWSGSRPACLPLPFICLPVLFFCLPVLFIFCLPGWVLVVGFPAGLSPTSFHLSPTSFHLSPSSFHLSPQAGCLWSGSRLACLPLPFICLPVLFICLPGFLALWSGSTSFHCLPLGPFIVSHFLSFVSQFVSQAGCLWSGSRLACLPLPFICLPICLPGWVLVVGFPAGLSPTSFHLSPTSFHLSPRLPGWLVVLLPGMACLPLPFICLPGRVPGWLVSHFRSFVSQAGCLWSGSRLACLPLPVICLPGWVLVVGFPAGLSLTSFHLSPNLSPRLGACGRVSGWLVSHVLSFVSQAGCLWSGLRLACLPLPFICLRLLFICLPGFPAGLSPTSFHLSPTSFHLSPSSFHLSGCLPAGLSPTSCHLSPTSFHLSPRLGACGRVCGWLVSHFLSYVSHFFSFVSQFFSFVSHFFSFFPKQFTVRGSQCFKEWSP